MLVLIEKKMMQKIQMVAIEIGLAVIFHKCIFAFI